MNSKITGEGQFSHPGKCKFFHLDGEPASDQTQATLNELLQASAAFLSKWEISGPGRAYENESRNHTWASVVDLQPDAVWFSVR